MSPHASPNHGQTAAFLKLASVEITAKQIDKIPALAQHLAPGTQVFVALLDASDADAQILAATALQQHGFQPKRRAVKEMKLPARTALPGNDEIEDEVRDYIALFCADTQPGELLALREHALVWMERMAVFRPHLGGAVWHGTATRLSDIYIQLFCDDSKSAEIALIDLRV